MPNIATILKSEISRLSRREIRKEVEPLRKMAAGYRREIAALKRIITSLERRTKALAKSTPTQGGSALTDQKPIRFVARGLVSLRKRLDLSADELARLLGVSMQSVYNWERKKATPRREQVCYRPTARHRQEGSSSTPRGASSESSEQEDAKALP
jgi:DNA-binding transcriptional regulator YiaG